MQRLDYYAASPEAMKALMRLEIAVERLGLDASLLYLVKLRASQINGCGFCVDLHAKDAILAGESPRRLHALADWRDEPCFTDRERAALAWTESLTLLPTSAAPDAHYKALAANFSPTDQASLTLAISLALVWNLVGVGFRNAAAQQR